MRGALRSLAPPPAHTIALAALLLIGLARGGYWVFTTEIWNPVDEAQHYAYVESLARGHGIPVVGEDKVSLDVLGIAKASPTLPFRSAPYQVSEDYDWGVFGQQYEGGGVQGPTYYAMLVPAYWAAAPLSNIASVYALRLASLLIVLTAIPITWLLARELFPRQPAVWLVAPAILVMIQGYNANPASISNDALVIPLSAAALIPVAGAWQKLGRRQAAVAGALFGLTLLTKMSAVPLGVMTGGVLLAALVSRRNTLRDVIEWGVIYSGAALAVLAPYFAWNLVHYGFITASEEVNAITGSLQPRIPRTLEGLRMHFDTANSGFWDLQPRTLGADSTYVRYFKWVTLIAVVVGAGALALRRNWAGAVKLGWVGVAFPVTFVTLLGSSVLVFQDNGGVVGRHVYTALVPLVIALSAGLITALGPRIGVLAALLVIGGAAIHEREISHHYIQSTYAASVLDGRLAPVVEQPWNEGSAAASFVDVSVGCSAEAVGIAFAEQAPGVVGVSGSINGVASSRGRDGSYEVYTLPASATGPFSVATGGLPVSRSILDRSDALSLRGETGDPVARVYCEVGDPFAGRFEQTWGPGHPDSVGYGDVRAWPTGWYWAGWGMVTAALLGMGVLGLRAITGIRRASAEEVPQVASGSGADLA